jgi:putative membrane protein
MSDAPRQGPRYGSPEEFEFRLAEPPPTDSLPQTIAPPPAEASPRRARFGRWFALSVGLFVAGALVVDAVDFVATQWERSRALGSLFTLFLAGAVGSALAWITGELRAYRRLRNVDAARQHLASTEEPVDPLALVELLAQGLAHRPHAGSDIARFRQMAQPTHSRAQILTLFAEEVLRPVDREAYQAVGRAARDVAAVTAVAPTAALDTLVLLWRTVRLVRQIAEIYGHRAGLAGTWFLLQRLASGAAIVAATDVAGNLLAQQLGGALAEVVATKLGEGAVAASRTARIGLYAMQLCRAVPFREEDQPTLRRLLDQILVRR